MCPSTERTSARVCVSLERAVRNDDAKLHVSVCAPSENVVEFNPRSESTTEAL